jgi:hypothetical protein
MGSFLFEVITHRTNKIHHMGSFLFGVIFFGAAAVGIPTRLVVLVCEDVPSPNNIASQLHINLNRLLNLCKISVL